MRVKDHLSSWGDPEKVKRKKRPSKPLDDSSDDIAGLTCQHVGHAVDVNRVKRSVAQNVWSICSDCLRERRMNDGEPVSPSDIWLCLKCGHQGCSAKSEGQHSMKHVQALHMDVHCIAISLSTWIVWCYQCDEELSTHCNKKVLAQIVDFLQKHASRTEGDSSKIIRLLQGHGDACEILKGQVTINNTSVPVKGIHNLGNSCFFNAVLQNLAQTHILNEMMHEMREKGAKLKICLPADAHLDPLVVNLSSPGPLTSAMVLFLHSMKDSGKGPLSPKVLFSQLCQKAPKFKVFQQQDSQELLHYLLDAMRTEETKRIQTGILKAFNNPTTKTADEDTKRKVKAYGKDGVKLNFIDRIFVGELTSTVMCEECENISTVKEPFIDLSLPIIEERGRTRKCETPQEDDQPAHRHSASTSLNNHQAKVTRKPSLLRDKNLLNQEKRLARKSSANEEQSLLIMQQKRRVPDGEEGFVSFPLGGINGVLDAAANGSPSEGSDKGDCSHCESGVDADSEASDCENSTKQTAPKIENESSFVSCIDADQPYQSREPIKAQPKDFCVSKSLARTISKLEITNPGNGSTDPTHSEEGCCFTNNSLVSMAGPTVSTMARSVPSLNPQTAFQTLSHSYITSSKECSIQSCLYQFTSVELLMGNNKLLCEICTDQKQQYERKINSSGNENDAGILYSNARKQMLISTVPTVLTLHLKRFHQAGLSVRKVNRHVDFPLILDLAPFCSASCENVSVESRVLYGLYGIVEHSGSLRGGHYAAYVKIRMAARKSLEHMVSNKNVQGLKDSAEAQAGQWVYVSDTHVQTVPESRVLNSQAYLLFYERLL
ncbi:ubiquitin carboxyl-terminal hydrolase 45 isoform X2 [Ambystoma mexicanum]|uniref:ubiquitin carboxyl-terminal hydrolase 45 isoform X2 n=1 Tax=Ambystoma mexicanum TaxID=8296 RepID=UPI0037E71E32